MNRVTPETPLDEILNLMLCDGYVLMENALTPDQVTELLVAYDQQLEMHPPKAGATRVDVPGF